MNIYETKERKITPGAYTDYVNIYPGKLRLRRMTDEEYDAIPNKFKSRLGLLFPSGTGAAFVLALIFSTGSIITAAGEMADHETDAGMHMFISAMLALFFMSLSILAVVSKLNRYVSRDHLVTAGEVVQITKIRHPSRTAVRDYNGFGYDCVIALHGRKELVTIRDKYPFLSGTTVLIIKTGDLKYYLYEIPSHVAAYDRESNDFSAEITADNELFVGDYSDYDKVNIFRAGYRNVAVEEYKDLPAKLRSFNPLSHGMVSVTWAISTIALLTDFGLILYAKSTGRDEMHGVTLALFFCLLLMEYIFSSLAFKKQLPKDTTSCIECIPVRKVKNMGHCLVSVIIPDRKQYIDRVEIEPSLYDSVRVNEEMNLYFSTTMPMIKYVRCKYDKY